MNKEEESLYELYHHTKDVNNNINKIVKNLLDRGANHDASKYETPEREVFAEHHDKLKTTPYPSAEYNELCKLTAPALEHHYANNRHHPQFHKNGVEDMTLCDLIELLCDWKSATKRVKNGNIRISIEKNAEKYNICPQLRKILENTIKEELP